MLALLIIAAPLVFAPASRIWIEGDSSMHKWSCTVGSFHTTSDAQPGKPGQVPAVQKLQVAIEVRSIKCGNGSMEEKLRDALHSDKHSLIKYVLTSIAPQGDKLHAVGELTVAGKARTSPVDLSAALQPDGSVLVAGGVPMKMTDFGVDPPSAMLGLMKTANEITVKVELRVRAGQLVN